MSKTTSAKKIRKRERTHDQEGEDFGLANTMKFLERISGNQLLSNSFERFSRACDELEESGLLLEDAVMAKFAINAGLAGYSCGDGAGDALQAYPWEA